MSGKWIAPADVRDMLNCHFFAEKEINIGSLPEILPLQIACESYYLLEVNSITVCRGPARGSHTINYFDEVDILPFVRAGKNMIRCHVWCMNIPTGSAIPAEPALWMQGEYGLESDGSWKVFLADREYPSDVSFYSGQNGFCEWRDLRYAGEGTLRETVILPDDSAVYAKKLLKRDFPLPVESSVLPADILRPSWVGQADLTDKAFALLGDNEKRTAVAGDVAGTLYSLTLGGSHDIAVPAAPGEGGISFIVSFEQEISGRFELELTAPAGTVVDLGHEDGFFMDGSFHAAHNHTNPTYNFSDRYVAAGGRQIVGNRMIDRGFRMVRVTLRNYGAGVILHRVCGVNRRYPFGLRSDFFCSDYQLNRLYEVSRETMSACITDVFTDCPWRERLFFTNDLVVENRTALQLFGDARLNRHAFELMFSEADAKGIIPSTIPGSADAARLRGSPEVFAWILSANLTLPQSLAEYLLYSGDVATVRKYYPVLQRLMATFRSWKKPDQILDVFNEYCDGSFNFFDWSFEMNGKCIPTSGSSLMNSLYVSALQAMEYLGRAAGADVSDIPEEIEAVRKATFDKFFDREQKLMLDAIDVHVDEEAFVKLGIPRGERIDVSYSKVAHALAVLAGVDSPAKEVAAALTSPRLFAPELYYGSFVLFALKKCGYYAEAVEYIRKYWLPVLDSGTPTLWENGVYTPGKAGFGGSASLCHGFSSSVVDFMQTALLGIVPETPGFATFKFEPHVCHLSFAKGRVPTPHGAIRVEWRRENGRVSAELQVPPGCVAKTPGGVFESGLWQFAFDEEEIVDGNLQK